jgi:hypothetical protein
VEFWDRRSLPCATFLVPAESPDARNRQLVILWLLGAGAAVTWQACLYTGWGVEEYNALGWARTTNPITGVLRSLNMLFGFASSMAMVALVYRKVWKPSFVAKVAIAAIVAQTAVFGMIGGWKTPLAILGLYAIVAMVMQTQRLPIVTMLAVGLLFVGVVDPVVSGLRVAARGGDSSADRIDAFRRIMASGEVADRELRPTVVFRDLAKIAGTAASQSSWSYGPWGSDTLLWGFAGLVPNAFWADKPVNDAGNYLSLTLGVDAGVSNRLDNNNSISPTGPLEFMGAWGYLGGILGFGFYGLVWGALCSIVLTPKLIGTSPLTPFMVAKAATFELLLGSFLGGFRDLIIILVVSWLAIKFSESLSQRLHPSAKQSRIRRRSPGVPHRVSL